MRTRTLADPRTLLRVVTFGLLALGTLAVAGCHGGREETNPNAFEWRGELKAPATLQIRNLNGSIEVLPSADAMVRVTAATRWRRGNPREHLDFQVVTMGNVVTVCALWGRGTCSATEYRSHRSRFWSLFSHGTDASVAFTVHVPTGVKVDASTTNGGVSVLATAPVRARSINGNVKVGTSVGPVDAETINGTVDARMTTLGGDGPVRAVTVNGAASAFVPGQLDAAFTLDVTNGNIESDFPIMGDTKSGRAKHLVGTIGAGGRAIEIGSVNGSVALRRLNTDGSVATRP